MRNIFCAVLVLTIASAATADMYITEWMYKGEGDEFIEFTNVGDTPVDMTGWYYEDAHHQDNDEPEYYDLSGFGVVQPGESVILTEAAAGAFRSDWGLDASVKIVDLLGDTYGHNIGKSDIINLFSDEGVTYVDVFQYFDSPFKTNGISGNIPMAELGQNNYSAVEMSYVGDTYGSYASSNGDIGNPGAYIPEPATLSLLGLAGLVMLRRRR